jgi:hypothetical protein
MLPMVSCFICSTHQAAARPRCGRSLPGLERLDGGEICVEDREISALWRAFREIAVPLTHPALLAIGLLAFIFSRNEFFFAVILTRAEVTTLPFILPTLMEGHNALWGDIAAIATIGAMPVMLSFSRNIWCAGFRFGMLHE